MSSHTQSPSPLVVIAIGGNSLIRDNDHQSLAEQKIVVLTTAQQIAEMVAQGWNAVVTHDNEPQVSILYTVITDAIGEVDM